MLTCFVYSEVADTDLEVVVGVDRPAFSTPADSRITLGKRACCISLRMAEEQIH